MMTNSSPGPKDYNIDDAKSNTPKIDELMEDLDRDEINKLYQLILEVIDTNDDGLNPELYEIRNSLRELQRQKLSDLFNIKETK